jgi:hypothetical protein
MRPSAGRAPHHQRLNALVEGVCVLIVVVAVLALFAYIALHDGNGALFHG